MIFLARQLALSFSQLMFPSAAFRSKTRIPCEKKLRLTKKVESAHCVRRTAPMSVRKLPLSAECGKLPGRSRPRLVQKKGTDTVFAFDFSIWRLRWGRQKPLAFRSVMAPQKDFRKVK